MGVQKVGAADRGTDTQSQGVPGFHPKSGTRGQCLFALSLIKLLISTGGSGHSRNEATHPSVHSGHREKEKDASRPEVKELLDKKSNLGEMMLGGGGRC